MPLHTQEQQLQRAAKTILAIELMVDMELSYSTIKEIINNYKEYQLEQFLYDVQSERGTMTVSEHKVKTK